MPRSLSSSATDLLIMEERRSAWMVSMPGTIPCVAAVSAMNRSARRADSRSATIHPTT